MTLDNAACRYHRRAVILIRVIRAAAAQLCVTSIGILLVSSML